MSFNGFPWRNWTDHLILLEKKFEPLIVHKWFISGICNVGYTEGCGCEQCETGKYKNETGNQACTDCPPGTYNNMAGQTSCSPCPVGTYTSQSESTACVMCAGTVINNGAYCDKISCSVKESTILILTFKLFKVHIALDPPLIHQHIKVIWETPSIHLKLWEWVMKLMKEPLFKFLEDPEDFGFKN